MGAVAKGVGIVILLLIIFGGYYLYSNGILATLVPSVFATPIQNILSNPQSYIGKTVTVYGDLGDSIYSTGMFGNGWYALYTPVTSIEIYIKNPAYTPIYGYNYTMTGTVSQGSGFYFIDISKVSYG
ncbi:MAG: hypothetical protein M1544_02590 [Candidatus Marsarchaeota archaeon]|nr:hypothetical protein [Candidatus Marsarchaeota archaeon]